MKKKILLTDWYGRVEAFLDGERSESACVTLLDKQRDLRYEAQCSAKWLRDSGVTKDGDEFSLQVIKEDGGPSKVVITYLPPKKLSAEQIQKIKDSVKHLGSFCA